MNESRVKMSNKLIEATYKIDVREKKLMLGMLNQVIKSGDKEEYCINLHDVAEITGLSEKSLYRDLKEVMRGLDDLKFKVEDDEKEELRGIFPFQDYDYKQGSLTFALSRKFKTYVLQHKEAYTKYFLRNVRPMRSVYSIRLYELLKQYEPGGAKARRFEIDKLKEMLQCEYKQFTHFRTRVIEQAVKEINEHSDITTSYFLEKRGRTNHAITFTIDTKETKCSLSMDHEEQELPGMPEPPAFMATLEKELVSRGVKWPVFKGIIKKYSIEWEYVWFFWCEILKEQCKNWSPKYQGKNIASTFDLDSETQSETQELFVNQSMSYNFRDMSHIPKH